MLPILDGVWQIVPLLPTLREVKLRERELRVDVGPRETCVAFGDVGFAKVGQICTTAGNNVVVRRGEGGESVEGRQGDACRGRDGNEGEDADALRGFVSGGGEGRDSVG
ncbi:MAG: hypothetical protein M1829_002113 [Trizodia sp. TS-e1964]|nr:MAG: hypothetical protein M1829_002113 [Trizodia sp. TS-e1964]